MGVSCENLRWLTAEDEDEDGCHSLHQPGHSLVPFISYLLKEIVAFGCCSVHSFRRNIHSRPVIQSKHGTLNLFYVVIILSNISNPDDELQNQ